MLASWCKFVKQLYDTPKNKVTVKKLGFKSCSYKYKQTKQCIHT